MAMEPSLVDAFKHFPQGFILSGAVGAFGFLLGLLALVLIAKRPTGAVVAGLATLALGGIAAALGILFGWYVQNQVSAAAEFLTGADAASIRAQGEAEASMLVLFGFTAAALPLLMGLVATAAGLVRRRKTA